MKILELLRKESVGSRKDVLTAVGISGISNASILAIINYASENSAYGSFDLKTFLMFVIVIALYITSLRFAFDRVTKVFEEVINKIRNRIGEKIRSSELLVLENIGRGAIFESFAQETATISDLESTITDLMNSLVVVVFASIYIAFLSIPAFLLIVALMGVGIFLFLERDKLVAVYVKKTQQQQIDFIDMVANQLDGFKEIKVNNRRSASVMQEMQTVSKSLKELKITSSALVNTGYVMSQCIFYVVMASIVFILPKFIGTYQTVITELTATTLFIIGPLSMLVGAIPRLSRANLAVEAIYDLEAKLDQAGHKANLDPNIMPLPFNHEIRLENVEFTYHGQDNQEAFSVGPLDFAVQKGELLMIVGGNGSGKSTVMKLLAALYYPNRGKIILDGRALNQTNIQNYRELISLIFSDFHLFKKLYGLEGIKSEIVQDHLKLMGLDHKTSFVDDQFTNVRLSTGQRKRLAMLVTLLEDRQIYMFDEWTADQDPEFRQYFYDELLSDLKKRGKTIIAISHDDRYFHVADKLIKLDYGKMEIQEVPPPPKPPQKPSASP